MHDEEGIVVGLTARSLLGAFFYLAIVAGSSFCFSWLVIRSQPTALAPAHLVRQAPACVRQRLSAE